MVPCDASGHCLVCGEPVAYGHDRATDRQALAERLLAAVETLDANPGIIAGRPLVWTPDDKGEPTLAALLIALAERRR